MTSTLPAALWLRDRFTTLYGCTSSEPAPAELFDNTFHPNVEIWLNHLKTSREDFRDDLESGRLAAAGVDLAFGDLLQVEDDSRNHTTDRVGIVAGEFNSTVSLKFRIRAAPAQTLSNFVFSAKIEEDPSWMGDAAGDKRRITSFFQTAASKQAPVRL